MAKARQQPALPVGPFDVAAEQITGLGGAQFASVVTQLLAAESARAGLRGEQLESTYFVNKGDGGVDAGLSSASATRWVPEGDSAWQFKAGDFAPADCEKELSSKTAEYARSIIKAGGSYRLVLGKSLTPKQIKDRRDSLAKAARALNLTDDESRIAVIAVDGVGRWLSEFPALAVDPALGGIGTVGQTYGEWARSPAHASEFVSTDARKDLLQQILDDLAADKRVIRVDGVSGLGKTRLVLEALRGHRLEPLVVYLRAADPFSVGLLAQLQRQKRSVILVVDECDPALHRRLAESVDEAGSVRLITVGEPEPHELRRRFVALEPLPNDQLAAVLRTYAPQLSHEQERVVVAVAAGNIAWARRLAETVLEQPVPSAGQLITNQDLLRYVTDELPSGQQFNAAAALALFRRVGFDDDAVSELHAVSAGLGISAVDLRAAARFMADRGMVSKQGRYRSVGPQPLALFLAIRGWEIFQSEIASTLVPLLSDGLLDRLFSRASELGGSTEIQSLAESLLDDGLLQDLDSVDAGRNGRLLEHLAVLIPDSVVGRLTHLLDNASDEDLIARDGVRRTFETALGKLAWHRSHFSAAANSLLRLAVLEAESNRNNANGTWVELFGAMLPGTAATPDERMDYLEETASSTDPRVRTRVVKALDHALDDHEFIVSASELQGGRLLERRGSAETYGEIWDYRKRAIDQLAVMTQDREQKVVDSALKALSEAVHGSLQVDPVREHLAEVFATFDEERLRPIRAQIASLTVLFRRAETTDGRPEALAELSAALPPIDPLDALWVLSQTSPWDGEPGEVRAEVLALLGDLEPADASDRLLALLESGTSVPAAFEFGQAIADFTPGTDPVPPRLASLVGNTNETALFGYLNARVQAGDESAFDNFVEATEANDLLRLSLAIRGPKTDRSRAMVDILATRLPVVHAARSLSAWLRDEPEDQALRLLQGWLARVETQEDYNAVVDATALYGHGKDDVSQPLHDTAMQLLALRKTYPNVGNEYWDWDQLASREMRRSPIEVLELVIELLNSKAFRPHAGSDEEELLKLAIELKGANAWALIMDWKHGDRPLIVFDSMRWLGDAIPVDDAKEWVGSDPARALTLAGATRIGNGQLPAVAEYLVETFPANDQIGWELAGSFFFGVFSGNESARLKEQITQVTTWAETPGQSKAVQKWAKKLRGQLEANLRSALKREAERDWD